MSQDRLKYRDPDTTRQRLLDNGRHLFHEKGYEAVGINEICTSAESVKGSFYYFFPSKQALLEAAIDENSKELQRHLTELARANSSGRARVSAFLQDWVDRCRESAEVGTPVLGCNIGTLASELGATNQGAREHAAGAMLLWQHSISQAIREGIGDGSISEEVNPEATSLTLLAVIQGMSTMGRVSRDPDRLQTVASSALNGLLPQP